MLKVFLAAFVALVCGVAFGQDVPFPIPDVDPLSALLDLIKNWKAATPLAIGMTAVVVLVQGLKFFPSFKYNRLAVTVLSVLYGVALSVRDGLSLFDAFIAAFIVGGGAVAIYEAWKGLSALTAGEKK